VLDSLPEEHGSTTPEEQAMTAYSNPPRPAEFVPATVVNLTLHEIRPADLALPATHSVDVTVRVAELLQAV
jgi:hypothetical protein